MKKSLTSLFLLSMSAALFGSGDPNISQFTDCFESLLFCQPICPSPDHTFMSTRPIYRNVDAQLQLWHDFMFNHNTCTNHSFQIMPMYSDSMFTCGTAQYFLFNKKHFLTVKGDDAVGDNPFARDIRAEWLGLPSNFLGGFTVKPSQRQAALWMEAKTNLRSCFNEEFFRHFWVGVAAPYHYVENEINLVETTTFVSTSTVTFTGPTTIGQALNNPTLQYQRFNNEKMKRGTVPEILFKFGTNFLDADGYQIGTWSLVTAPLAGTNDPTFVFSPMLGNNRHFGMGLGVSFQIPLNCVRDRLFAFYFEAENIYFIRNFQRRTLDLKFKPYSRYILLVNKDGRMNVPATQVLTQRVRVRPYNMADVAFGFRFQQCGLEVSAAYCLWLRSEQRLRFHECFPKNWGIQGVGFLPGTTIPATASESTIQRQADNDVDRETSEQIFVPIIPDDVQLQTGAARGALNQRAQFSIGYLASYPCWEFLLGAGAFIEVPHFNTDLKRWGVWAKFGASV